MKIIKKILILLLIIFVIMQFFGPKKNQGEMATVEPFLQDTNPPETVKSIFIETCFDCHSDHTRYPWYDKITPVNYFLADHVTHGKGHLNFSSWKDYSTKKKDHKLEEVMEMVEKKEMPLPSYTWTHTEANLTEAQIKSVIDWTKQVRFKYSLEAKPQ